MSIDSSTDASNPNEIVADCGVRESFGVCYLHGDAREYSI